MSCSGFLSRYGKLKKDVLHIFTSGNHPAARLPGKVIVEAGKSWFPISKAWDNAIPASICHTQPKRTAPWLGLKNKKTYSSDIVYFYDPGVVSAQNSSLPTLETDRMETGTKQTF